MYICELDADGNLVPLATGDVREVLVRTLQQVGEDMAAGGATMRAARHIAQ